MNNFKSVKLLLAATTLPILAAGTLPVSAVAQQSSAAPAATLSPTSIRLDKSTVAQFSATYHVPLVQDTTPMVPRPLDSAPPTARVRDLQKLAVDANVTWRKIYRVSPATADNPVTTLASAEAMVDQPAQVTLTSATGLPEATAFKTVAAADNAIVKYTGDAADRNVNVNLAGSALPEAIAALARQTGTHWQAVYLLAPIAGDAATPSHLVFAGRRALTEAQSEDTRYNDGPFTMHFPVQPVRTPAPTPAIAASQTAAASQQQQPQQVAGAAQAGNPAHSAASAAMSPYGIPNDYGNALLSPYASPYQASPYGAYGGYNPYGGYYPSPTISVGSNIVSTPFYGYGGYGSNSGAVVISNGAGSIISY